MKKFLRLFFVLSSFVPVLSFSQCVYPTVPHVNDTTICDNQCVFLTLTGNLNNATGWYWYTDSCGGTFEGSGSSVALCPSVTTVYYIRGEGGCVTAGPCGSVTITVKPSPTANNSAEVDTPADCGGSNGGITGVSATGIGPFQYSWDSGPFSSSSALSGASFGTHALEILGSNGCSANYWYFVPNPAPPVINNSGVTITKPSCGVSNGSINGVTATGAPALVYSWNNGVTYSSSSTLNGVNAGIYHLLVKDGHNCTATDSYTINSTSGTTPPTPIVNGVPSQLCYGDNLQLSIANPSAGNTYSWTTSTGLTGSGSSFTVNSVHPVGTNTYGVFVMLTDNNGCQNSTSVTFSVNALPVLSVSPSVSSGCMPICAYFSNNSFVNGTFFWTFGNGDSSTAASPIYCYTVAGTYYVVLHFTDANGCKNNDTALILAYPTPVAAFTTSPQPTTINNPVINFADISGGATITSWYWDFGVTPVATSTLQNPSFTYQDTGTYFVKLFVSSNYGCYDSIIQTVRIDPAIGIKAIVDQSSFGFYPNPVNNTFFVWARPSIDEITIVNLRGEIVRNFSSKSSEAVFDVSTFSPGMYMLRRKDVVIRFLKE